MSLETLHSAAGAPLVERNGVRVALNYGAPAHEQDASRKNILMVDYSHYGIVEVVGDDGYDFLNRVVAGDLSVIRDEQALYTLLLNNNGEVRTDLYVLCDDERFVLMSEWVHGDRLASDLKALVGDEELEINALTPSLSTLLFEGPYAWELMAELYGYDVLGLPFLEFMRVDDGILLRAGKHGEFSYKLLVDREKAADVWQRASEAGVKFDMKKGGIDFQGLSRLENPCWDPAMVGEFTRCPIELQMQWAVRYDKDEFIGRDALLSKLETGPASRVVGFRVSGDDSGLGIGDEVRAGAQSIGKIITFGYSPLAQAFIGQALLSSDYAFAGVDLYHAVGANGPVAISSCGIPFVQNFSFLVNPSEHSYVDPSRPKNLLEQLKANS